MRKRSAILLEKGKCSFGDAEPYYVPYLIALNVFAIRNSVRNYIDNLDIEELSRKEVHFYDID